ncbi:MAG: hypothetical protein HY965_02890 [Ignavibacteriales bacterium]|nr:hypothetical protein [Ignavibacteriales bacterium]
MTRAENEKIDAILVTVTEIKTDMKYALQKTEDHEARLRLLEKGYWKVVGAASVIATVLTYVFKKLGI